MPALPIDYLIHWGLELLGGGACACATTVCRHRVGSLLIWFLFSIATTYATVQVVG
jgi:hypothetical protein